MVHAYKIATRSAAKVAEKSKTRNNKHVTPSALDVGDRELVRNVFVESTSSLINGSPLFMW